LDLNMTMGLETIMGIALGIGLSAAVGFRLFVPFTLMSIAALTGYLDLTSGFEWIGTYPALLIFATATVLEIVAYYVPWLDNLLDTVATPAAIVAGAIVTASVVGDISPLLRWTLAVIAGGGVAGAVQTSTTLLRGASSVTTGGIGNPVITTAEVASSFSLSVFSLILPLAAATAVLGGIFWLGRKLRRPNQQIDGEKLSTQTP
jgi:hypothetical protein